MTATAQNTYTPHGAARDLFRCKALEVVIEGPAGTGKSRSALEKCNAAADKYPGCRQLITRKTRASMSESVLVTFENKVLTPDNPIVSGAGRAHRTAYNYPNGSTVAVLGLDNPDRIMSTEWDRIYVFEATEAEEHDHEMLMSRLRNGKTSYHQIVLDCNPSGPNHWINRRATNGMTMRLLSRHQDNPYLFTDGGWTREGSAYMSVLDRLTGHRRSRLRDGRWTAAEGLVYPEFDAAVHIVKAMPKGWEAWRKFRAIDFGINDPFVCQWWAVDDDRMYLYREIYKSGRIVEDHAREIVRLSAGEVIDHTVADHDKEDRMTLERHGVPTIPATKDITLGIDAVKARLQGVAPAKPRLYLLESALVERDQVLADAKRPTSTVEEFDCYIWKKHRDGIEKDAPVDRDNHGMDTMRYAVMGMGGGGFMWGIAG